MTARLLLQGIEQASLLVDNEEKYVRVGRGVLIYVAFMKKDATVEISDALIEKVVQTILTTKIFTHFCPERMVKGPQALEDHPEMDLLVVPQASLCGKLKGTTVQFHQLVDKHHSEDAFHELCHRLRLARGVDEEKVDGNGNKLPAVLQAEPDTISGCDWLKYAGRVVNGTFGNRQGLRLESDGPFTHFIDVCL
eukprot:gene7992-5552_t